MLGADKRQSERRREGGSDDGVAQRLPLGKSGYEGQDRKARDGRDRRDNPDPGRFDSDRLQPYREKRQMGPDNPNTAP